MELKTRCSHLQWKGKRYEYNAEVSGNLIQVKVTPKNQELERALISAIEKKGIENITLELAPGLSSGSLKKD